jgi:hypothetical protein
VRRKEAEELKENEETDRAEGGGEKESAALSTPCAFVVEHSTPLLPLKRDRGEGCRSRAPTCAAAELRGAQSTSAERSRAHGGPSRGSRRMACLYSVMASCTPPDKVGEHRGHPPRHDSNERQPLLPDAGCVERDKAQHARAVETSYWRSRV